MKVTEHKLGNGQAIRLQTLTGVVLSASSSTTTSIHQTAPEVLNQHAVLPGQIYSKTHSHHKIWLKLEDGREHSADIGRLSIPAREGHVVSLVYGGPVSNDSVWLFGARNHTTGKVFTDVASLEKTLREWKLSIGVGRSIFTWVAFGAVLGGLIGASTGYSDAFGRAILFGGLGAVVSFFLWGFFGMLFGPGQRAQALVEEIDRLGQQALMKEREPAEVARATVGSERPAASVSSAS